MGEYTVLAKFQVPKTVAQIEMVAFTVIVVAKEVEKEDDVVEEESGLEIDVEIPELDAFVVNCENETAY